MKTSVSSSDLEIVQDINKKLDDVERALNKIKKNESLAREKFSEMQDDFFKGKSFSEIMKTCNQAILDFQDNFKKRYYKAAKRNLLLALGNLKPISNSL